MLSSLTTTSPSHITSVSNAKRRVVTLREPKEVTKVDSNDDFCSTSETVNEDESEFCSIDESGDYYYQKEKWNPNNYSNPLKKIDYSDDDVSLQLDDVFPETRRQHSSSEVSFPRLDLMHGTRNLNVFLDSEVDDEVELSESFAFICLSPDTVEAGITDEQHLRSSQQELKKITSLPMHEFSTTTVENTSFQSLSESQAF
jgi:hypothetical protein